MTTGHAGLAHCIALPPWTVIVILVVVVVVFSVTVVVIIDTYKCTIQDWDMWRNWFATWNCRCHRGGRRWKTSSIP